MTEPLEQPEPASTGVAEDLETLRARLEQVERERDDYRDRYLRAQAEFQNYQKRFQRDLAEERRYSQAPLASDLLAVLDNFDRASEAAAQAGETGPLVQGVDLIRKQLMDLLRRHGITPIEAQGQPFDPNLHQAIMQQPTADHPAGTVLQVLEQGFRIHDRVLRPANVVVATKLDNQA